MGMLISRHKDRHTKTFTGPTEPKPGVEAVEVEPVEDLPAEKKRTKKSE